MIIFVQIYQKPTTHEKNCINPNNSIGFVFDSQC